MVIRVRRDSGLQGEGILGRGEACRCGLQDLVKHQPLIRTGDVPQELELLFLQRSMDGLLRLCLLVANVGWRAASGPEQVSRRGSNVALKDFDLRHITSVYADGGRAAGDFESLPSDAQR